MQLQAQFGLFPRITGKGDKAKILADMLLRLRQESMIDRRTALYGVGQSHSIENLIIIDRECDFITPLLTQLTYEGLIDEKYGIKNSNPPVEIGSDVALVELDVSMFGGSAGAPAASSSTTPEVPLGKTRKQPLNSTDLLYASLRDSNFAIVGTILNRVARRLMEDYEGRHQAKTVSQIREFVNKLGGLQAEHHSLRLRIPHHFRKLIADTNLAEDIMTYTSQQTFIRVLEIQQSTHPFFHEVNEEDLVAGFEAASQTPAIEELIARNVPATDILRLLCLQNLVSGPLKPKDAESLRKQFLQVPPPTALSGLTRRPTDTTIL
jgi:vacuolar protein sorting-associated protein 33A